MRGIECSMCRRPAARLRSMTEHLRVSVPTLRVRSDTLSLRSSSNTPFVFNEFFVGSRFAFRPGVRSSTDEPDEAGQLGGGDGEGRGSANPDNQQWPQSRTKRRHRPRGTR